MRCSDPGSTPTARRARAVPSPGAADAPLLVVVSSAPIAPDGERFYMDIKAIEGLKLYARYWPGRVRSVARIGDIGQIPFGRWYETAELPFEVLSLPTDATAAAAAPFAAGAAAVLASGDNHRDLDFVDVVEAPVVFVIENPMWTTYDIIRLSGAPVVRRLRTLVWLLLNERRRRRAFRRAAGIQANGTPAFEAYRRVNADPLQYFDTRLSRDDFIGRDGADAKAERILAGQPLRLAFSGRLEPIKGADHLVPVMKALRRAGPCAVTLDVYGDGSLRGEMQRQIDAAGLGESVRLRGALDFETELVPTMKQSVDAFLCCHRQADPSCTYLETLGCGTPIVGYLNNAFAGVLTLGPCGAGVPMDDIEGLAAAIRRLDADRPRLAGLIRGAAEVAGTRLFEDVFAARIEHLRRVSAQR